LTAVLEETATESVTEQPDERPFASWLSRAGALFVDVLFWVGVTAAVVLAAATRFDWLWWVPVAVGAAVIFLVGCVTRCLVPELTGWSLGRALFGIAVVRTDGKPAGLWRLVVRDCAHLLDTAALFIGWMWPLWDERNRTFADLLLRTEVRRVDGERPDVRRLTAAVLIAGAVVAATGAGLTYLTVYRHERAVDTAESEIAEVGPRIVERILSYNAGTLKDDFAQAQGLVTEGYRDQLIAQQHRIEKNPAANNEYWAVTSSVVRADPAEATMLVFLQGQYQAQKEDVRFSTATTRVTFHKSDDGKWRVSNLEVFPKPVTGVTSP
jgi:Mce-associated membrane protein